MNNIKITMQKYFLLFSCLYILSITANLSPWSENDLNGKKFIFFMSTGHCGTKFLYKVLLHGRNKNAVIRFEDEHGKMKYVQSKILQPALTSNNTTLVRDYVKNEKIPAMLKMMNKNNKNIYVDTGHQVSTGLLEHLIELLGDKIFVVYVERNRMRTAASFAGALNNRDPCKYDDNKKRFRYCPFQQASLVKVESKDLWNGMNSFQKFLWWSQEIEARWEWIKDTHPQIDYIEIKYKDHIGIKHLDLITQKTGLVYSKERSMNHHVNKHNVKNFSEGWMISKTKEYDIKMNNKS